jgi:adenylate kinase
MRIVLLGPPASGKGTLGRFLSAELRLGYLSTGALLRENIEQKTPLGLAAEPILARGAYLPDDLMCQILADWLSKKDQAAGWVLDGFPRSLDQAKFLDHELSSQNQALHCAVALEAPFEELLQRIQNRVECPSCRWSGQKSELSASDRCPKCGNPASPRADDDEHNFRNRHAEFLSITTPAIEYYRESGKLLSISAVGSKEETSARILAHITSFL